MNRTAWLFACFLLLPLHGRSQCACIEDGGNNPLHYYLLAYPVVLEATVIKEQKTGFQLEVTRWLKTTDEQRTNKITVHYPNKACQQNAFDHCFGLEVGQSYLFILGNRGYLTKNYVLFHPVERFKIVHDSLFLSYPLLSEYHSETIRMDQPNTFHDPLNPTGYKMAVGEVRKLVVQLNKQYRLTSYKKGLIWSKLGVKCMTKHVDTAYSYVGIQQLIMEQTDSLWMNMSCPK